VSPAPRAPAGLTRSSVGPGDGVGPGPEVKTIRRKITAQAASGSGGELQAAMARRHVGARPDEANPDLAAVFYVDGHVRAYQGGRKVAKTHIARLRFPAPATAAVPTQNVRSAATSARSKPSVTGSPLNPQRDPQARSPCIFKLGGPRSSTNRGPLTQFGDLGSTSAQVDSSMLVDARATSAGWNTTWRRESDGFSNSLSKMSTAVDPMRPAGCRIDDSGTTAFPAKSMSS
jgi:hypothetical protein